MHVMELVKWAAVSGVQDADMIEAVEGMLPDLKTLPGFRGQTLYKDAQGKWVDLYFWDSEREAHASNDLMAGRPSFGRLMALIDPASVTIEIFHPEPAGTICPVK